MVPKAVVLDLDGTVLTIVDGRLQVTAELLEAVQYLHERGVPVILATGRAPRDIQMICDLFPDREGKGSCLEYVVCNNGGCIYDVRTGHVADPMRFSRDLATDIVKHLQEGEHRVVVAVEHDATPGGIVTAHPGFGWRWSSRRETPNPLVAVTEDPMKLFVRCQGSCCWHEEGGWKEGADIRLRTAVQEYADGHSSGDRLTVTRSLNGNIECGPAKAEKGSIIWGLLQRDPFNLTDPHDVLAFGDNVNDISMGRFIIVAVGSKADPWLLEVAYATALGPNREGVAR